MACNPPFIRGTGGWCGCNCGCCPPPCCDVVEIEFRCGTPIDDWFSSPPNPGCDCAAPTPLRAKARNALKPVAFPEFDNDPIESPDGEFVFALSGSCSVPCTNVIASVTTDACCLEIDEGIIYSVGTGLVSASLNPTSGYTSCGDLKVFVNGEENSAYVADGAIVTITVESEDASCCPCCQYGDPTCATPHTTAMMNAVVTRRRAITRGKKKGFLKIDQEALKEKLRNKTIRSKPSSEPQ